MSRVTQQHHSQSGWIWHMPYLLHLLSRSSSMWMTTNVMLCSHQALKLTLADPRTNHVFVLPCCVACPVGVEVKRSSSSLNTSSARTRAWTRGRARARARAGARVRAQARARTRARARVRAYFDANLRYFDAMFGGWRCKTRFHSLTHNQ